MPTVTFFPVTVFPTWPLFLFFLSLYSYCYPNELLPFFLFLFFPFVHCYFLSCYFFSYLSTVTFFPVTFFPFTFFPTWNCYFLSCYFFSCYFLSVHPLNHMHLSSPAFRLVCILSFCQQYLWTSRNSVINSLWLCDAIWWQPMLTSHEWGSGGIHQIVTSHWTSKPLCCIMSLKIVLLKLLPPLPGISELITCRQIRDKAYLYRPTQITERFQIFLAVVTCEVYHLTNKFCWHAEDSILAIMLEIGFENSELNKPGTNNKN